MIPDTPENKGAALFDQYLNFGTGAGERRWWTGIDLTQPVAAQITALSATLPPPWNEVARQDTYGFNPDADSEIAWTALVKYKQDWDAQSLAAAQRQTVQQDDMGFGTQN